MGLSVGGQRRAALTVRVCSSEAPSPKGGSSLRHSLSLRRVEVSPQHRVVLFFFQVHMLLYRDARCHGQVMPVVTSGPGATSMAASAAQSQPVRKFGTSLTARREIVSTRGYWFVLDTDARMLIL